MKKSYFLTPIENIVDTLQDGSVLVYSSRRYRKNDSGTLSFLSVVQCLANVFFYTRVGMLFSQAGDMKGFEHLHAIMGAKSLNYCKLKVTVKGIEHLSKNKNYIFAPTHGSTLDIFILYLVLRDWHLSFVAKEEFRKNSILRIIIGKAMTVSGRVFFVKREDAGASIQVLDGIISEISRPSSNISIVIYPLGSRSVAKRDKDGNRVDGDLFESGSVKPGTAYLSFKSFSRGHPIEVVPIIINGINRVWDKTLSPILTNQEIEVVITPPLHPAKFKRKKKPIRALSEEIERLYRRHYNSATSSRRAGPEGERGYFGKDQKEA